MSDSRDVPDYLKRALELYVEKGYKPGDFLLSCLANDFLGAVGRADTASMAALPDIAAWIYNVAPGDCHGSYDIAYQWMQDRTCSLADS